ncbi:MAG: M67 family metallopeptidase [Thermoplasmata archaeon]|nr:M67 family metallopeptidase [Thermoplasmata archaeon]
MELSAGLVDEIRRHGEATYPEECCGFLVARDAGPRARETRRIVRVASMENRLEGERERRFVIPPEELRRFERSLEGTGESVVGFYHSHPDHPAVPSRFDEENAWPWYSYLVLSVDHGWAGELGAFELDPEKRRFASVLWAAVPDEPLAR